MGQRTWTITDAKAKFSEVINRARTDGPQTITRNGHITVVVVSAESGRKSHRPGNLAEFFAGSPLRDSGLEVQRPEGGLREADL